MRETVYRYNGEVINIGSWDDQENPVPEGAIETVEEVLIAEDGGRYVKTDYKALRRKNYPPIQDQLDALWKGGSDEEAMRSLIASIKALYPKA